MRIFALVRTPRNAANRSRSVRIRFSINSASAGFETDEPDWGYLNLAINLAATFRKGKAVFLEYETVIQQENVTRNTINFGYRMEF